MLPRAALAGLCLVLVGCREPGYRNQAPTVVITAGPSGRIETDTARFEWQGQDADGRVVAYYYGLDEPVPGTRTESTAATLSGLVPGPHCFYVQAEDDSGARSLSAVRSFTRAGVVPHGDDSTLEIVTWNVQNFPKRGAATVELLRALMRELDYDIYTLQEIEDTLAFVELVAGLDGYAGLFSRDDYGSFYQKTAVIYRQSAVAVSSVSQLFWGNDSVPRPPLVMTVDALVGGRRFDFRLVVLHWKAGLEYESQVKRAASCRRLKSYIDDEVRQGQEPDFVAVGDWNDELLDPPGSNVFQPFLDDSLGYRFLTMTLAGNPFYASYIGGAMLDHILVTQDALGEYGAGWTTTLRLDDEVSGYESTISDHRPVVAVFTLDAWR